MKFADAVLQGLSLATGQCNVKTYNRYLRDLIIAGKAKPSFVVSHEVSQLVAFEKLRSWYNMSSGASHLMQDSLIIMLFRSTLKTLRRLMRNLISALKGKQTSSYVSSGCSSYRSDTK